MFRFLLIILFSGFIPLPAYWVEQLKAQNTKVDSLKLILEKSTSDTLKCLLLGQMIEAEGDDNVWPRYNDQMLIIAEENLKKASVLRNDVLKEIFLKYKADALNNKGYLFNVRGNFEDALKNYFGSLEIREKIKDQKGVANSLSNIGVIYFNQGKISKVMEIYEKGLSIQQDIGDKRGLALTLNNIGFLFQSQGDIAKALEYFHRSLALQEETGDKYGQSVCYNNIGKMLETQGENNDALKMITKSLKLRQELNFPQGISECYLNIGLLYNKMGDVKKAMEYNFMGLKIQEQIGNKNGMGYALANIARIYLNSNKLDSAQKYFAISGKIREEVGDKRGLAEAYYNIGAISLKTGKIAAAILNFKKGLQLGEELGYPSEIKDNSAQLYKIYRSKGDAKSALAMYELHCRMRDSLNNESNRKSAIKSQLKYEYEKQAAADSVEHAKASEVKNAELKRQEAEIKAKKNQQYALFGGLGLVMIFAGFMYNRFKITQKQKLIIEHQKSEVEEQKKLVEEKQKEVLDSIYYARRIQMAQIPSEKQVAKSLEKVKKS